MKHPLPLLFVTSALFAQPLFAKPKAAKPTPTVEVPAGPRKPTPAWPFRPAPPESDMQKGPEPGGLGIVLGEKDGEIVVQQVVPGGPAQKAGLRAGDVLEATDAMAQIRGMKLADVTPHIRGLPGSICKVTARRDKETLHIDIPRIALKRLFPPSAKDIITVKAGASLLTTGATHQLAVTWLATQKGQGDLPTIVTARIASADLNQTLTPGTGEAREIRLTGETTALQIEDWRLDLRLLPDGETVAVTSSNLPVVDAGTEAHRGPQAPCSDAGPGRTHRPSHMEWSSWSSLILTRARWNVSRSPTFDPARGQASDAKDFGRFSSPHRGGDAWVNCRPWVQSRSGPGPRARKRAAAGMRPPFKLNRG